MTHLNTNRKTVFSFSTRKLLLVLLPAIVGGAANKAPADPPPGSGRNQFVVGDMALVPDASGDEHLIVTWAVLTPEDDLDAVGVTIPVGLFDDQPTQRGTGPAGAIASLVFPEFVQEFTYLNHFELQSQPNGHPAPPGSVNPDRNRVPHFDFHFFAVPEEVVWDIPLALPPLPLVAAERLPAGYTQPGPSEPQMGRHAAPVWSLLDPDPLSTIMIAGFLPDGSAMHFIEPMVSRERLLECEDFKLPVPMPAVVGGLMLYPTKFEAKYDRRADAYHFVFSKFEIVQ